jgi:hypothetical protein
MQIKFASTTRIAMQIRPVPPVEEYEEWLQSRNRRGVKGAHRQSVTAAQIRRVVVMRRQGSTWTACGAAIGRSGSTARDCVEFLPLHLAV